MMRPVRAFWNVRLFSRRACLRNSTTKSPQQPLETNPINFTMGKMPIGLPMGGEDVFISDTSSSKRKEEWIKEKQKQKEKEKQKQNAEIVEDVRIDDYVIQVESFFDTYRVVQEFKRSGFTEAESKILTRYMYDVLKEKMNWINKTYAPKVDLENETYLFEAAHSELLFEVTNSREISIMNLTNDSIILKRWFNGLNDETIAEIKLNDDLIKLELNQFKHENNLQQRELNLKNSDLNSRIISDMVSGLKSDIETYRWQLTRAGIVTILTMAVCILSVWNVAKRVNEEHSNEKWPRLVPVHEQTDEESHDYEADWDESVPLA